MSLNQLGDSFVNTVDITNDLNSYDKLWIKVTKHSCFWTECSVDETDDAYQGDKIGMTMNNGINIGCKAFVPMPLIHCMNKRKKRLASYPPFQEGVLDGTSLIPSLRMVMLIIC